MQNSVEKAKGRLGVLVPGLGAVATTFIAGVAAARKNLALPVGSFTQMGKMDHAGMPGRLVKDCVPLAGLEDLVFGGWDVYGDNVYKAAKSAGVLDPGLLESIRPELESIQPMKAVFDPAYVRNLVAANVKRKTNRFELAESLIQDIRDFRDANACDRLVMVWCGSTEVYTTPGDVHESLQAFEKGLQSNDPRIAPSMVYAYAALKSGVPFANGAPNLTVDIAALEELAEASNLVVSGKDFKTGQTMIKTILAPGLKARCLGIKGWFSDNILGNRDGLVLSDSGSFKTKEVSKLSVLENILKPWDNAELYNDLYHKTCISYYPPRGDNKESWDNIDIFGWLGYPMQIKIDFLCRDSILAAPLVLDLVLLMDLAQRAGRSGMQEWLSFYYKSPHVRRGRHPEHDIFRQLAELEEALHELAGEASVLQERRG